MKRKVLGNDPFRRGAAGGEERPAPPQAAPAGKPGKQTRPQTPELQVPRERKGPPAPRRSPTVPRATTPAGSTPARHEPVAHGGSPRVKGEPTDPRALPAPLPAPPRADARAGAEPTRITAVPPGSAPRAHPGSPSVPVEPRAHPAAPTAVPLGSAPRAHPGSPSVPVEPRAHPAAPTAVPLGSAPRAHPGSPSVPFEPRAHPAAPTAVPLGSAPRAHPGSPSVPVEPRAHPAAPTAVPLGSAPRAHAGSPFVPFEPTPHAGTPSASPLGPGPRAHAGSPSVPFEPTPHAGTPAASAPRTSGGAAPSGDASTATAAGPAGRAPRPPSGAAHQAARHADPPASAEVDAGPPAHRAPVDSLHADAPGERTAAEAEPVDTPAELSSAAALDRPPATLPQALKGLVRALRTAAGLPSRSTEVDSWGKDPELTRLLRPLGNLLYERYWRVHTAGIDQVPRGPCILVANHAGALPLDGPVLHLALARERTELKDARWLLEDQVFHAPFVGLLANRLGAVRASPENALKLLGEGRPVIVFPEGFHGLSKSFSERYQLRRFGRGGYLKIALRAGCPVVPVAIVGGEESMPLLAKVPGGALGVEHLPVTLPPLPARWYIRFGAPVDFTGAPAVPEDDLAWIERTNLEVRDRIEAMLGELLAQRPGVF